MPGETLAGVGAIIGALIGAITFLLRALIHSKDAEIKELSEERDYWRDIAMGTRVHPKPPG